MAKQGVIVKFVGAVVFIYFYYLFRFINKRKTKISFLSVKYTKVMHLIKLIRSGLDSVLTKIYN